MKTVQQSEKTEKENFKIFNKINIEKVLKNIPTKNFPGKVILTGGHYRIFSDEKGLSGEINSGTIKSLKLAKKTQIELKNKNIGTDLGILINDMGVACDENICSINDLKFSREDYKLPSVYYDILNSPGKSIKHFKGYINTEDDIKIFWEKNIKNKAKKYFIKILKAGSYLKNKDINIERDKNGFFISDPEKYGKIILTRTQGKDKYGTPACPLIMAGFNISLWKLKYSMCINFYYIGQDNSFNIPNYFVIEKGKRVAELFGCDIDIVNIYLDKI